MYIYVYIYMENRWKTSGHNDDRTAYRQACRRANKLINDSRRSYHSEMIDGCTDSQKISWAAIKKIQHSSKRDIEESDENNKKRCQSFADYFCSKITCIRQTISTRLQSLTNHHFLDPPHVGPVLSQLMPVNPSDVAQLLASNNSKSSNMDFILTSLVVHFKHNRELHRLKITLAENELLAPPNGAEISIAFS